MAVSANLRTGAQSRYRYRRSGESGIELVSDSTLHNTGRVSTVYRCHSVGRAIFSVAGVQQQPTYQVGERVLYVWLTDTLQQQCIAQAVILGKLDVAQAFRSNALQSMFHNGLNYRNTDFYDTHRIQYDRASYIRDFSNSGPIDIWSGDWSVHGNRPACC